jgi:hypothetical protein
MTFVVGLLYLAILAGLAMLFLYLRDRLVEKREISLAEIEHEREESRRRLEYPRWAEVERTLGRPVPVILRELYGNRELVHGCGFLVFDPTSGEAEEETWFVNEFLPANPAPHPSYAGAIPPGAFAFATNEFGDPYYFVPGPATDGDGPVFIVYHDGGDTERVAPSLRAFLGWRRRFVRLPGTAETGEEEGTAEEASEE